MEKFMRWLREWDWRPLTRLLVWCCLAGAAASYYRVPLPDPATVLRELIMGWLLSFGLLTWVQIHLLAGVVQVYLELDGRTFGLAEKLVRPIVGRAPFAVNFASAFTVQIIMLLIGLGLWRRFF